MSNISFTIINKTGIDAIPEIIIFQKNTAAQPQDGGVFWKVINKLANNQKEEFLFSNDCELRIIDSENNTTIEPKLELNKEYSISTPKGEVLVSVGNSESPYEIEIQNASTLSNITAQIYKHNHLLMAKSDIAPGSKAEFHIPAKLWICSQKNVNNILEGVSVNHQIVSAVTQSAVINTKGIKSADLIMKKVGSDFTFTMENVVRS